MHTHSPTGRPGHKGHDLIPHSVTWSPCPTLIMPSAWLGFDKCQFLSHRFDLTRVQIPRSTKTRDSIHSAIQFCPEGREFEISAESNDLLNEHLSLLSLAISITKVGTQLVSSVVGYCDWYRVPWCQLLDILVRQHYKVTMNAHCHKLTPVLI